MCMPYDSGGVRVCVSISVILQLDHSSLSNPKSFVVQLQESTTLAKLEITVLPSVSSIKSPTVRTEISIGSVVLFLL